MKTSTYSKIALAAILGATIVQSGSAWAANKPAGDDLSVYEYGPWGVMGTPAAGPETPIAGLNLAAVNLRDTPHNIIPPTPIPPPEESTAIGWATNMYHQGWGGGDYNDEPEGSLVLTRFTLPAFTPDPSSWADQGEGSVEATPFVVSAPVLPHPDEQRPDKYNPITSLPMDGYAEDRPDWHYPVLDGEPVGSAHVNGGAPNGDHSALEGNGVMPPSPAELDIAFVGEWEDGGYGGGYQQLVKSSESYSPPEYNEGVFVYGTPTPQKRIDQLRLADTTMEYNGETVAGGLPVYAKVDFGAKLFNISVNKGRDSGYVYKDDSGNLHGNIGFTASGHLSGAHMVATNFSANDGTINAAQSTLQAALLGGKANTLIGGHEIVKSHPGGENPYENGRHADVFVASQNGVNVPK